MRLIFAIAFGLLLTSGSFNAVEAQEETPPSSAETTTTITPGAVDDATTEGSDDQAAPKKLQPEIPESEKPDGDTELPELPGATPLSKNFGLWVDLKRKWVIIDGKVCLRKGVLEMFACPKNTKEHESLIAIDCPARFAHAALLAVGAKPGRPVQFDPEYAPAQGQQIDVHILWLDKDGKKRSMPAQQWIRNTRTKKAMKHSFVFAGSDFWEEMIDGKPFRHYQGDAGDFICVSNFPSATLDLPIKSSKENSQLLFEAFTENIPPRGTRIRVVLIPRD